MCANYFIIINVYILFYFLIIINALQYNRERTYDKIDFTEGL